MATRADTPSRTRAAIAVVIIVTAAVLAAIVSLVASATKERIERNEQAWLQQRLDALIAPPLHDNDLLMDRIVVSSPDMLGTTAPVTIFRARLRGQPVAAVIYTIAPEGYQGPIEMLVAVGFDGTLIGVQIVRHRETQGLGDQFENRRADWLRNFKGLSLKNPPQQRWSVRKDGGDFDEFTGATITPRAIVRATRRALEFYASQRDRIYAMPPQP